MKCGCKNNPQWPERNESNVFLWFFRPPCANHARRPPIMRLKAASAQPVKAELFCECTSTMDLHRRIKWCLRLDSNQVAVRPRFYRPLQLSKLWRVGIWWERWASNPHSSDPQSDALPIKLQTPYRVFMLSERGLHETAMKSTAPLIKLRAKWREQ